jgi:hypothetical protein
MGEWRTSQFSYSTLSGCKTKKMKHNLSSFQQKLIFSFPNVENFLYTSNLICFSFCRFLYLFFGVILAKLYGRRRKAKEKSLRPYQLASLFWHCEINKFT